MGKFIEKVKAFLGLSDRDAIQKSIYIEMCHNVMANSNIYSAISSRRSQRKRRKLERQVSR